MPIETNTGFRAYTGENLIRLVNYSSEPLINIKLLLTDSHLNIIEYMIIRERGTLTFSPPLEFIELGNLYPEESAEIRYKSSSENLDTNSYLSFLDNLKISYSLTSEESITTNLNTLILSTD